MKARIITEWTEYLNFEITSRKKEKEKKRYRPPSTLRDAGSDVDTIAVKRYLA